MKQVKPPHILDIEIVREIATQLARGKEMEAEGNLPSAAQLDLAPVLDVILFELADILDDSTKAVGGLPTERTVVMKCPEVTRAISFAISGMLATGR